MSTAAHDNFIWAKKNWEKVDNIIAKDVYIEPQQEHLSLILYSLSPAAVTQDVDGENVLILKLKS